jgi:sortase A
MSRPSPRPGRTAPRALRTSLASAYRRRRRVRPAVVRPAVPASYVGSSPLPELTPAERFSVAGAAVGAIAIILLGFLVQFAGVSQLNELRSQQLSFNSFRSQLANATAPVGQLAADGTLVADGDPVAILRIPALGLSSTVLEGTSSTVTKTGPGLRRDSVLPGQSGSSVVYGRQSAYGGSFAGLGSLTVGDTITAVTGQGRSTYRVTAVRYPGDSLPAALTGTAGRLTLVSASGLPFFPSTVVRVDATLTSSAYATPNRVLGTSSLRTSELPMAGDPSGWPVLVLALAALCLALALFALSRRFWGVWQTWIVATPVLLALGCFAAGQAASFLPNLM